MSLTLTVTRQDITSMQVDAIVNAGNTALKMGGGVCGAIFRAAGAKELKAACRKLSPIQTGEAVITPGFRLPAKYIIHTAGPVCKKEPGEAALLHACYTNALKLAVAYQCSSIAFPLIASGIYGYSKTEALNVAMEAIVNFLFENDMSVYIAVPDWQYTIFLESVG